MAPKPRRKKGLQLVHTKKLVSQTKKAEKQSRKRRKLERTGSGKYANSVNEYLSFKGLESTGKPFRIAEYWDSTAEESLRKDLFEVRYYKQDRLSSPSTFCTLNYREEPDFIEIYSIDVRPKGTGFGTEVMTHIKNYADEHDKGVVLTKVQNERFAEKMGFKRRDPKLPNGQRLSEVTGYAEYVYGDVPKDAVSYFWVYGGDKLKKPDDYIKARDGSDRSLIKMSRVVVKKDQLDGIKRMFEAKGWYTEIRELYDGGWVLYGTTEK